MSARTNPPTPPPHSVEAEASVLGAILINPDCFDTVATEFSGLDRDGLFYVEAHNETWRILCELQAKAKPIDIVCIIDEAKARQSSEVTPSFLVGLSAVVPTSANVTHYARQVVEKYRLRQLLNIARRLHHGAARAEADSQQIMLALSSDLGALNRAGASRVLSVADGVEAAVDQILNLHKARSTGGLLTGLGNLDGVINGLDAGSVCVIAARPSVGKTALAVNIAANVARAGVNVLIFSLEMGAGQLIQRMIYSASGVEKQRVLAGHYGPEVLTSKLRDAVGQSYFQNIHIVDSRRATHFDLCTQAKAFKREHPLGLVVVDYLQLLSPSNPRAGRESQVAEASREIKILAEQAGCPVLLLSQLNRAAEEAGEPSLAHLRESGAIEQDADIVVLLSRGEGEVIRANVAKNRNGQTGTTGLMFDRSTQTFRDWAGDIHKPTSQRRGTGFRKPTAAPVELTYSEDDDDTF